MAEILERLDYLNGISREIIQEINERKKELDSLMSEAMSLLPNARDLDEGTKKAITDTFKEYLLIKSTTHKLKICGLVTAR